MIYAHLLFNNYKSQSQWIALNNPRVEVEEIIQKSSSSSFVVTSLLNKGLVIFFFFPFLVPNKRK